MLNNIREQLDKELQNCKDFLLLFTKNQDEDLKKILETPKKDLPKLLNVGEPYRQIIGALINNEDPPPETLLEILYDVSMNTEEYRSLGYNDGALATLRALYETLGETDKATDAANHIYKED